MRATLALFWLLATSCLTSITAVKTTATAQERALAMGANPIRKVVTMMQKMAKKLEEEAEVEEELYKKFECYCKKTKNELKFAIDKAVSIGPITPEDIEAKKQEIQMLEGEVSKLKGEKTDDEESLKAAKTQRKKEHDQYEELVDEDKETVGAAEGALKALGVATPEPSFVQVESRSSSATASFLPKLLRGFDRSKKVTPDMKDEVAAFLQGQESAEGAGDDVKVYIEDVEHEAEDEIKIEVKEEKTEEVDYGQVKKSKKNEISALLNQMENKMRAIGKAKVEIVNMKHAMADGAETLEENKKMLAEVTKNCKQKAADWEERKKYRAEEQLAIADAIKMLNSDDALELFKKTIKPASLLQLSSGRNRKEAKAIVDSLRAKHPKHRTALNFIALALEGKKVNFDGIFKKIDEMVALMKKEQSDDDAKKDYCNKEFDAAKENIKAIGKKQKQLDADVDAGKTGIAKLEEELVALRQGVKDLDASIAEAAENRQGEHAEYQELMMGNSAATKLIGMAKDRLNHFYNPSLAPDTATTTTNPYAFVQVSSKNAAAGPVEVNTPPPTFGGDYKAKGQESNGVLHMMDQLVNDLEKEMTVAKTEEANAQKDYEETVADAKKKRAADVRSAEQKAQYRSDLEADLIQDKDAVKGEKNNMMAAQKYISDLHAECDWLLQNFDLRKQARAEESESMTRAKAVLAGADFS